MTRTRFYILIAVVVVLAGLTLGILTALGVPPLYILLGAMAASVMIRFFVGRR